MFFRRILEHHESCYYNAPFLLIVSIIIFNFVLERWLDFLNSKDWSNKLPDELKDVYDADQYKRSQDYKRVNDSFGLITSSFSFLVIMFMLFYHVFGFMDSFARTITSNPMLVALIFFGILMLASDIINTPFALYDTFIIEEQFGFNKTTLKTYFFDKVKGWVLTGLIGGGVIVLIIWLYSISEHYFWVWAWAAISLFMIFISVFYSTLIVPLFNKQTPLEEGDLRNAISDFCKSVGFQLTNVFVIDGSKRSTKANAYFTGLGKRKRIVLYDTLINDLTTKEIVAVLAHEIGHYKKKHTISGMIIGILQTGLTLYIFSLFTVNPLLSYALGAKVKGVHMALMAFGVIYSPLSTIIGLGMNFLSRKNEYEADNYAKEHNLSDELISGLKKLSSNNLNNLTPHKAYVFFHFSHPTLLQRIRALGK
ncbi:MAG: M48 family metallopeptidase [Bacteroidales bacterium]|nr:M48 family metallopeptidase [Bacteroidales bacterium]MBN2820218.1 M48 family metallopeptidase [Bacteroidales bacterium]